MRRLNLNILEQQGSSDFEILIKLTWKAIIKSVDGMGNFEVNAANIYQ